MHGKEGAKVRIFSLAFTNPTVSAVNNRSSRLLQARLLTAAGTGTLCEEPAPVPVAAACVEAAMLLKKRATHRHSEEGGILPAVRFLRLLSPNCIAAAPT